MSAELLHSVEEGLQQLAIASDHPSNHCRYTQLLSKIPVTCLKIPNKFFVAADKQYKMPYEGIEDENTKPYRNGE